MARPTNAQIANDLRLFGRNLCAAHERLGIRQTGFAKLSGCDRSMINRIESGKQAPKFDTLLTLARAAFVEPADLLDGIGPYQQPSELPSGHDAKDTPAARFGLNLKWAREQADLKHEDLWSAADVDRSLISAWEKGKSEASLRTILKLARALEVPPAVLLHGVGPVPRAGHVSRLP
jgi:transcriptional regulator with XRE-family HTH domain